jgi:RHS repeat-associated protein
VASMTHPQNLAGTANLDQYRYDPVTGALNQVTGRLGAVFQFEQDKLGRPTVMHMPGLVDDSVGYDPDGRMAWHRTRGPNTNGYLLHETMRYDGRGKLVRANNFESIFQQWYSGIGNLVATDWQAVGNLNRYMEESVVDPLGNVVRMQKGDGLTPIGAPGSYTHYKAYEPGQGRVIAMAYMLPSPDPGADFEQDSTAQWYDEAGNLQGSYSAAGEDGGGRESQSRHFYGADDRLRAVQRVAVRNDSENYSPKFSGVWEEYRYDPLGRRIMVRTRMDGGLCDADPWLCTSSITRFVWAGDQILWELRAPGNDGANLEATTATGAAYGQVSYTHTGGIDRPLVITKNGTSLVPHQNWRGMFALATRTDGYQSAADIDWPGFHTTPWHGATRVVESWWGSLSTEMRDATGQIYKRNRYYDPASGQFTQPDPIGLAGGLNSYGFAAGDPVSYSDPYGLCPYGDGEHNTDTSDCPNDDGGRAVRLIDIYGGDTGNMIIAGMAQYGLTPVMRTSAEILQLCGEGSGGCQSGTDLHVLGGQPLAELAADITHEAGHGIIPDTGPWDQQLMFEQSTVEAWALEVYSRIPSAYRATRGGRGPILDAYRRDPAQWRRDNDRSTCVQIREKGGTCE